MDIRDLWIVHLEIDILICTTILKISSELTDPTILILSSNNQYILDRITQEHIPVSETRGLSLH
jgi:hypothetical protein